MKNSTPQVAHLYTTSLTVITMPSYWLSHHAENSNLDPLQKTFSTNYSGLDLGTNKKLFSLHSGITETLKNQGFTITAPTSQSLMPSPLLWSSFSLWLIATSAMFLMMLPGSATTHHIISLFITVIESVLAYCGYSKVIVKATAIANLSRAVYHRLHQQALK